jgi:GT2 family glycosyltransferase
MKTIDLSIIIVSYNTKELTCDCIRSIYDSGLQMHYEIIVYDNASEDGSAETISSLFPAVTVIQSDTNIGFAAANNIASATASGNWVLLLNPDTRVLDQGIARLFQFAVTTDERAIYGGASMTPEGDIDHRSCWAKPSLWGLTMRSLGLSAVAKGSRLLNPEEIPGWNRDTVEEVGVITGCFLMIKKTIWEELGGFDVDYFMYSEETDLCLRAHRHGIRRIFYPNARILHISGASERSKPHKTIKLFRGKRIYFEKHYASLGSTYASMILDLHVLLRLAALRLKSLLTGTASEQYAHWLTVWRERASWNVPDRHLGRFLEYDMQPLQSNNHRCYIRDSIASVVL